MIQAVAMVLDFAPIHWSSGTRMVAIALADRVNQDREAWPSIDDLSRRTGLDGRSVQRHLRILEDDGVITRVAQRMHGGRPVSNLWRWHWLPEMRGDTTVTPGVTRMSPLSLVGGVTPVSPKP